jgi:nucleoside-diphosphate-sugar epimerase
MQETPSLSVYVTGATEGLGRAVIRQLVAQGHKVAGSANSLTEANLIRSEGGLPVYNGLFRASEIASTLRLMKADVVVNAAPQNVNALPLHNPDWDHYTRMARETAAACAEAAAMAGVRYVVHTSFAFLYGDTHGESVSEDHALDTGDPLFAAAAAGEKAVLEGAVPACVLRAGLNYGPDSDSIHALHRALISRGPVNVGSSDSACWIHQTDLANAIVLAVTHQPPKAVFNIVDDQPLSPAAFVDSFADHLGVARPGKTNLPTSLAQIMQRTIPAGHRALLATSVRASNISAKERLGWQLEYPTSETGIAQTLLAWRAAVN